MEISEQNDKRIRRVAFYADKPVSGLGCALFCGEDSAGGDILYCSRKFLLVKVYCKRDRGGGNFAVLVSLGGLKLDVLELGSDHIVYAAGGEVNLNVVADTQADFAQHTVYLSVDKSRVNSGGKIREKLQNLVDRGFRRGNCVNKSEYGSDDAADTAIHLLVCVGALLNICGVLVGGHKVLYAESLKYGDEILVYAQLRTVK